MAFLIWILCRSRRRRWRLPTPLQEQYCHVDILCLGRRLRSGVRYMLPKYVIRKYFNWNNVSSIIFFMYVLFLNFIILLIKIYYLQRLHSYYIIRYYIALSTLKYNRKYPLKFWTVVNILTVTLAFLLFNFYTHFTQI